VFIALILIILFNKFVMGYVLHHFTHIERHATSDREQFSFAFKYALGMFFTTALMTLFVEAITYNNFYKHDYGVI
jgi:di/tricarboxylate transporter